MDRHPPVGKLGLDPSIFLIGDFIRRAGLHPHPSSLAISHGLGYTTREDGGKTSSLLATKHKQKEKNKERDLQLHVFLAKP
jgi:hypothetical protein